MSTWSLNSSTQAPPPRALAPVTVRGWGKKFPRALRLTPQSQRSDTASKWEGGINRKFTKHGSKEVHLSYSGKTKSLMVYSSSTQLFHPRPSPPETLNS